MALLLVGAGAIAAPASAAVLVSNLGQPRNQSSGSVQYRALEFTTGANTGGYTLTQVKVKSRDTDGDEFSVSVCTVDSNGEPTATCTSLTSPASFAAGDLTFTAPANTTLDATTTYAVRIGQVGTNIVSMALTTSDNEDSGGATGWSIGNNSLWSSDGSTWTSSTNVILVSIEGTAKSTCPTGQPDNAIWKACLTVGSGSGSKGFSSGSYGTLNPTTVTLSGTSREVIVLSVGGGRISLVFNGNASQSVTSGWVLQLGSNTYGLSAARYIAESGVSEQIYEWYFSVPTWSDGQKVSASLTAPPTASDGEVETTEDTDYTFEASDFNYSGGGTLASVKVISLPGTGKGTLKLDGSAIGSGDLPEPVLASGLGTSKGLVYEPPEDANGDDYTSFTFKVNDGTADSTSTYTMTIDVDSAPDVSKVEITSTARSGSSTPKVYGKGEEIEVTVTFDEAVTVTGDPHVDLQVGSNERDAVYESGSGSTELVFAYTVVMADEDTDGVSIAVNDLKLDSDDVIEDADENDADVTHAAVAASTSHKVDGDLTPPNRAPTASNGEVTVDANGTYTFAASEFDFMDQDSGDTLSSVKVVSLPGTNKGSLKLDGTAIASGDLPETVTKANLDGNKLVYEPPSDATGTPYTTFTFKVNDGTADSASTYTMTINVRDPNVAATGRPEIEGELVRLTALRATKGTMADENGLPADTAFKWQWVRQDDAAGTNAADISGATAPAYYLGHENGLSNRADHGKWLAVKVTFEDEGGTTETLKSEAIGPVNVRMMPYRSKAPYMFLGGECRGKVVPAGSFWKGCLTVAGNGAGANREWGFQFVGGASAGALSPRVVRGNGPVATVRYLVADASDASFGLSGTTATPAQRWTLQVGGRSFDLSEAKASTPAVGTLDLSTTSGASLWSDANIGDAVPVSLRPTDLLAPRLLSATIRGATVTLTYDEALNEADAVHADRFRVRLFDATGRGLGLVEVRRVTVSGTTVTLRLGDLARGYATVTLEYKVPRGTNVDPLAEGHALQDLSGNRAAAFGPVDLQAPPSQMAPGDAPGAPEAEAEAGDEAVTLTWTAPEYEGTLTGWELRYGESGGGDDDPDWGEWTAIEDATAETASHTVTGLENGTTYVFELRAMAGEVAGEASATVRATPAVPEAPGPPDLQAEAGDGAVTLYWLAPSYQGTLTGWELRYGESGGGEDDPDWGEWTAIEGAVPETAEHTVTGLENGTTYVFELRATAGSAAGEASATVRATPAAAVTDPDGTRAGAISLGAQSPERGRQFFRGKSLDRAAGDAVDYYTFTTDGRYALGLGVREQSVELKVTLEDADGATVGTAGPPKDPNKDQLYIEWLQQTIDAGTYYVRVEALSDGETDYHIRFGLTAPVVTDPDGTRTGAISLGAQSPERGRQFFRGKSLDRAAGDAVDYYTFTTDGRYALGLGVRGQSVELKVTLEDANGATVGTAGPPKDPSKDQLYIEWLQRTIDAGTYYVRVKTLSDGETDYYIRFGLTVPPPELSVADDEAEEGTDATLDFAVTLDKSWSKTVTVDYATADGTAVAGDDYTATSGTLTFAVGETEKTVSVPVLNDEIDEGSETLALRLSSAQGATIEDDEATGTITNSDAIPQAWLARFGRTVTGQVLDAVEERLNALRGEGVKASLTGQVLPSWRADDSDGPRVAELWTGAAPLESTTSWLAGADVDDARPEPQLVGLTERDLVAGTSFEMTGGSGSLWGRGSIAGFDGREGNLTLDGEVTTGLIGADWATGNWIAGVAAGHSRGTGGYRGGNGSGDIDASLTGLYPYAGVRLGDRLSAWTAAGWGSGEVTVRPEGGSRMTADLSMSMGAAGLRGEVLRPGAGGGLALALKGDARFTRTSSDSTSGMKSSDADVWLARAGVESSRRFALRSGDGGVSITPSFEAGLRLDGGDAESGMGADMGGGLSFTDPEHGLSFEMKSRALVAHEASGFREWGASVSASWDSRPQSDRGLSASLRQDWGASPSGGMDALLSRETLAGLVSEERGAGFEASSRLEGELGYGLGAFGGSFTGTPNLGFGLSETARDYRVGWRLSGAREGGTSFEVSLDATRREPASDDSPPEQGVTLKGALRW